MNSSSIENCDMKKQTYLVLIIAWSQPGCSISVRNHYDHPVSGSTCSHHRQWGESVCSTMMCLSFWTTFMVNRCKMSQNECRTAISKRKHTSSVWCGHNTETNKCRQCSCQMGSTQMTDHVTGNQFFQMNTQNKWLHLPECTKGIRIGRLKNKRQLQRG